MNIDQVNNDAVNDIVENGIPVLVQYGSEGRITLGLMASRGSLLGNCLGRMVFDGKDNFYHTFYHQQHLKTWGLEEASTAHDKLLADAEKLAAAIRMMKKATIEVKQAVPNVKPAKKPWMLPPARNIFEDHEI